MAIGVNLDVHEPSALAVFMTSICAESRPPVSELMGYWSLWGRSRQRTWLFGSSAVWMHTTPDDPAGVHWHNAMSTRAIEYRNSMGKVCGFLGKDAANGTSASQHRLFFSQSEQWQPTIAKLPQVEIIENRDSMINCNVKIWATVTVSLVKRTLFRVNIWQQNTIKKSHLN